MLDPLAPVATSHTGKKLEHDKTTVVVEVMIQAQCFYKTRLQPSAIDDVRANVCLQADLLAPLPEKWEVEKVALVDSQKLLLLMLPRLQILNSNIQNQIKDSRIHHRCSPDKSTCRT